MSFEDECGDGVVMRQPWSPPLLYLLESRYTHDRFALLFEAGQLEGIGPMDLYNPWEGSEWEASNAK